MNKKEKVRQIFNMLNSNYNNSMIGLKYKSNFELLIAVILSARTTDKSVNKATSTLYKIANNPESIIRLGKLKLMKHIKIIGLYKKKSKYIIETCKILKDKHKNIIPNNREELEKLPGVGRKTANIILNEIFGLPTIAVDTHVLRISNKIGISSTNNTIKTENLLLKYIPKMFIKQAHKILINHGRNICKAKNPQCYKCSIKNFCEYYTSQRIKNIKIS